MATVFQPGGRIMPPGALTPEPARSRGVVVARPRRRSRLAWVLVWGLAWMACFGASGSRAAAAELQDAFGAREVLTGASGTLAGSNVGATREALEPDHADKPGGASVWVSWVAPTNGIATFRTRGSGFDTLLAIYYFRAGDPQTLDKLEEAGANDDDPGTEPASTVQFAAKAGRRYEIAIDGYRGATGAVALDWDFVDIDSQPPIVVSVPGDRSVRLGDPVTLSVNFETVPDARLQWRFNGDSFGAEGPTLFIPSLQVTNVGRYSLRVRIGDVRFETAPVEIQVNSEGQTNALARDKAFDALDSRLTPDDHGDDGIGAERELRVRPAGVARAARAFHAAMAAAASVVARGYAGTQIFNTTYATPDPTEPVHCGVAGGSSYWFAYTAPTNGTLTVDTDGSAYDTILAAYGLQPPAVGFESLVPIACDNDAIAAQGASRVAFPVLAGTEYLLVVDGVGGARGIARLNYRLAASNAPVARFPLTASASFTGVFTVTNLSASEIPAAAGLFTAVVRTNGAFSGSLRQARGRVAFRGKLGPDGTATAIVRAPGAGAGTVTGSNRFELTLALNLADGLQLTGRLATANWGVETVAERAAVPGRAGAPANLPGRYTVLLPGADPDALGDASGAPVGDGFAAAMVSASGRLRAVGGLADGTALAQGVTLTGSGTWPVFVSLPRGRGLVTGRLRVVPGDPGGADVVGAVGWLRWPGPRTALGTNGFLLETAVAGSAYVPTPDGRGWSVSAASWVLDGGGALGAITNAVWFGPAGRLTNAGPGIMSVRIAPATGVWSGSAVWPGDSAPVTQRGVVLPRMDAGGGYFLGAGGRNGRVQVVPSP